MRTDSSVLFFSKLYLSLCTIYYSLLLAYLLSSGLKDKYITKETIYNNVDLNALCRSAEESQNRVKYVMSHDEIGNFEGSRLVSKLLVPMLHLNDNMILNQDDLKYLEENFGFKVKVGSYSAEAKSLADAGITSIKLADTNETALTEDFDGSVDNILTQQGATFTINGEEHEYADIWHKKLDNDTVTKLESEKSNQEIEEYTDPISFTYNGKEYTFIADIDGDNKFTDASELIGGKGDWKNYLLNLADKDGNITGENLSKVKFLATEFGKETLNSIKYSNKLHYNKRTIVGYFKLEC